jgi:hypothetical protein
MSFRRCSARLVVLKSSRVVASISGRRVCHGHHFPPSLFHECFLFGGHSLVQLGQGVCVTAGLMLARLVVTPTVRHLAAILTLLQSQ